MAKSRGQLIKEATIRARKDFLAFARNGEREILDLYLDANTVLLRRIRLGSRAGKLIASRRLALLAEVDKEIAILRRKLNIKIKSQMRHSLDLGLSTGIKSAEASGITANIQIGTSFIGVDGKVRRYDAATELFSASQWAKIDKNAMDFLLTVRPTGSTFAQSVWGSTLSTQSRIKNMVNRAVLLGDSSQRLAGELSQLVTKRGLQTSPGRYTSAYKNSWRLAAAEMNRAYTEGQLRYAQTKTWIDGVIWRRGGPGPCTSGQCPAGQDRFYPKGNAPALPAHPWCMCYFEDHIKGDPIPDDVAGGPKPPTRPIPIPPSRKNAEKIPKSGRAE